MFILTIINGFSENVEDKITYCNAESSDNDDIELSR